MSWPTKPGEEHCQESCAGELARLFLQRTPLDAQLPPGSTQATAALPVNPTAGLTPGTLVGPPATYDNYTSVLIAQAGRSWPRCIVAQSREGRAFDLNVRWTGGNTGRGGEITVTAIGGSVRLYLVAATMDIRAANWDHNAINNIDLGISEEAGSNTNTGLVRTMGWPAIAAGAAGVDQPVPPFAIDALGMTSVAALLPAMNLQFLDPAGVGFTYGATPANSNPISVPGAPLIRPTNGNPGAVPSFVLNVRLGF